jgi:cell division protease FtsH
MQLPERDKLSMSYEQMTSRLAILFGGRVAEELIFGKDRVTSGASSDISQATKLARAMVTKWGYSEKLGVVEYGENQDEVFLGHSVARSQNVSEATAEIIDAEVKRLTQEGFDEARRILNERLEDLHTLAKAMLEYETLSGEEIANVLKGVPPVREETEVHRPSAPSAAVPLTHVEAEPETAASTALNAAASSDSKPA